MDNVKWEMENGFPNMIADTILGKIYLRFIDISFSLDLRPFTISIFDFLTLKWFARDLITAVIGTNY